MLLALTGVFAGQTSARKEPGLVSIPLVPRARIPPGDLRLISDNQAAIARSAEIYGYMLDSTYDFQEIACPLTPNHLLLAYESMLPNGAASRFTAVVPRSAPRSGGIQIISISHFGSIPFLPAQSNPHTLEVFNRVVSPVPVGRAVADNPSSNPLLFNSLCYLGMIGETPAALTAPSLNPATVHAPVPTMQFRARGSVTQVLSVRNSSETYEIWRFAFGRDGRLLAAEKTNHPIDTTPPIMNAGAPLSPGMPLARAEDGASPAVAPLNSPAVAPPTSAVAAPASVAENPVAATPVESNPSVPVREVAPSSTTPASSAGSSAPVAPNVAEPASAAAATPATTAPLQPVAPAPAAVASAKSPGAAKVVPLPPGRLTTNLPLPPSRLIRDGSLPYPPQAPAK